MKLHCMGRFSGDPASLPHGEHKPGAVPFKEAQDPKKLALLANGVALVLMILLLAAAFLRGGAYSSVWHLAGGWLLSMAILLPHELLHAVCFKKDVYLYTYRQQGMLFVVGPEDMSRGRFVFMSLLPNLVFGLVPYLVGMVFPQWYFLLIWGALALGMGAGDYYNVFNALTQMPRGARTYLYQFNSWWYMPQ
ncbi:hypothetical protein B5E65_15230 [Gemmiger sp. An120]|uniref:DUF3267 domain-containing protein n=1 Tax=Gemmiger sp. An120 TaxID=1965549 RepID=UPI000B3A790C|nr:DUF3267 domain-containing protein [Gemmiger sp. An120]OUQ39133.1 hypothetical protein B5E65_15230 [Gemmiger sp. An120]HIX34257.1 DUF3267 domain-containing protein [Candidatus Gemmiger avium]